MFRLAVDFNTMVRDKRQRIWINTTMANQELLNVLQPDLRVILYDPPDEVEEQEDGQVEWFGVPDWATQREMPMDE